MRSITGFLILMVVIIAIAVGSLFFILSVSNNIFNNLEKLEKNVSTENWDEAEITFKKIQKEWEKGKSFFPLLVDHANLHDLNITLTRISSLLRVRFKREILPEISVAKELSKEIYQQEKFSLKNVF